MRMQDIVDDLLVGALHETNSLSFVSICMMENSVVGFKLRRFKFYLRGMCCNWILSFNWGVAYSS